MKNMEIPQIDDFHIHLRQGPLMELVTSQLKGVRLAYVMPNTKPPIKSADQALEYRSQLQKINPDVQYIMTLYLSPDLTAEEVKKASAAGIKGVKSYPRGVTTNSDQGIEDYRTYYPVFEAMEEVGMILNLHGEIPPVDGSDICVLNAEEKFLTHLKQLHADFPKLKIVLEHATTKAAVDMVKSLGDTVGCTITLHHLSLTVDDWAGQCFNYCKPVAKYPHDREALREVILQGSYRI
jgi:dihydroorotase